MAPINISSISQLKTIAKQLAQQFKAGDVIYLLGDLGAGKTTFTQLLLRFCGVKETVKSPTYTLYENYQGKENSFVHMDLYRLTDPEELFFLGIEDLINGNHVVLIEWPSKGLGVLPAANWILEFKLNKSERSLHITSK